MPTKYPGGLRSTSRWSWHHRSEIHTQEVTKCKSSLQVLLVKFSKDVDLIYRNVPSGIYQGLIKCPGHFWATSPGNLTLFVRKENLGSHRVQTDQKSAKNHPDIWSSLRALWGLSFGRWHQLPRRSLPKITRTLEVPLELPLGWLLADDVNVLEEVTQKSTGHSKCA